MSAEEVGKDRLGGEYRNFAVAQDDLMVCKAACENDGICRSWTYVDPGVQQTNGVCWLKKFVNTQTPCAHCTSGYKVAENSNLAHNSMSDTEVDMDRLGLEYLSFVVEQNDQTVCLAACKNDSRCRSWTYVDPGVQHTNGKCWLKSGTNINRPCSSCTSGYKSAPTNEHMGSEELETDRLGNEYYNVALNADDQASVCKAMCQEDGLCGAWTYVDAGVQGPTPRCWLKSSGNTPKTCTVCTSGVKEKTLTLSPIASNQQRVGNRYKVLTVANELECLQQCEDDNKCMSWNYNSALTSNSCGLNVTVNDATTGTGTSGFKVKKDITLAAGQEHMCFVQESGSVKCWGTNTYGQLGDGTMIDSDTPVSVGSLSNATQITAGNYHSCAILADRSVQCWGRNDHKQLGNGNSTDSSTPVLTNSVMNAIQLAATDNFTCAVQDSAEITLNNIESTERGVIKCWGSFPILNNRNSWVGSDPQNIVSSDFLGVKQIAVGNFLNKGHVCAAMNTGEVKCLGKTIVSGSVNSKNEITTISGITNAVDLASSDIVACAIDAGSKPSENKLKCWGLINGKHYPEPIELTYLKGAQRVVITAENEPTSRLCAVMYDGTVKCSAYGKGDYAVSGITDAIKITITDGNSCALIANGEVKCWDDEAGSTPTTPVNVSF
ncbi:PAN domain-containing protein [Pseudoalteromonas luteoviolacea]|uniref:Apple domain-containing protein n=1 Tax=Pseudoalteromonas luteoviolacea S4054 TaxID=1129367 RepID=A0A0F6AB37_9GAMM|nr:PAN domain-containing protein [Pseudoalteromonas luteoviolacea]AOT08747.1 hypothetical protein S4054249_13180 [Pseudoalteromonas luteoviolacea]AOT13661.1 hypothetical protein S40542_13150 [Pseudoalteromonas luteoviolacea]AOT18575.1 hypothetical protein S4054_13155 [Pseudoalteromonas luteoviolacea]KKE83380.1 hypothetical protein N479_14305 [Pseudoalteromonas luteoviolacea S4054]KZN77725.1 hypothetical protein N481_26270 [Pseudoalteromonas luteoviolacea S4047-1]